jgi:hypothetical protein
MFYLTHLSIVTLQRTVSTLMIAPLAVLETGMETCPTTPSRTEVTTKVSGAYDRS